MPYLGYPRQDRKDKPRVPIRAELVEPDECRRAAGDHHGPALGADRGFFDIPMDHLFAAPVFVDFLSRQNYGPITVVSPDTGGAERARAYAKRLGAGLAIVDKRRPRPARPR